MSRSFYWAINACHIIKAIVDLLTKQNMKELTESVSLNSNLASDLMFQLKLNKHAKDVFTVYVE